MKLSSLAKVGFALGISLAIGTSAEQAYGLVHKIKPSLVSVKLNPELLLRNWGLDNDELPSHINARKAWNLTKGKKSIVVAVIDTGIDPTHPDLKDNLWHKTNNKNEYGFDFVTDSANPSDKHGHGTHVAGIIGATAKANAGASGVAPNISIMPVRYYSDSANGATNLANTIKAINYAIDNGANIINYSGGGAEFSAAEMKAIQRAESKGIIFVAAAGNEYQNTDEPGSKYYPGAYGLSNIITVAATNIRNQLLPSSNWGFKNVHVAAPGEGIFSTLPNGRYGYLTGTSQATAFVSGLAALILSENPKLSPEEVKKIIMNSTDKFKNLESKVASGGRINAYNAVLAAEASSKSNVNGKVLASINGNASALSELNSEEAKLKRKVAFE